MTMLILLLSWSVSVPQLASHHYISVDQSRRAITAPSRMKSVASIRDSLRVVSIPASKIDPPLVNLNAGEALSVRVFRVALTGVEFGRLVRAYQMGLVHTAKGATYQRVAAEGFKEIEPNYQGNSSSVNVLGATYQGKNARIVDPIKRFGPDKVDGYYLGVWDWRGQSVVGTYSVKRGRTSTPLALFSSRRLIDNIDFMPSVDGPVGYISVIRKRPNGQVELIDLSIMITRLYKI